jgi:hypothetical protein
MKYYYLVLVLIISSSIYSQEDPVANANENTIASLNMVDALSSRIPGAKKITDRMGNRNLSLRGRQSFTTASDEVLWEIDGIIYQSPPTLNMTQVKYVEVLSGLSATNKYGSQGGAGVIIVKTNVSAEKLSSAKNLLNRSKRNNKPKKLHKKIKKKKTKNKNNNNSKKS